jgi:hypothetical protein
MTIQTKLFMEFIMKKGVLVLLMLAAVLAACTKDESDFESRIENGQLVLIEYTGNGGDVVIPSRLQGKPVAVIGDAAFREKHLTSVTIPKSVTTIGDGAFLNNQLASVTIPNSVTTIGLGAFADNQLTNVTIPNSVTTIAYGAFLGNQLNRVTIGANVEVNDVAFDNELSDYYDRNGKKAGTYTRNGNGWNYTAR